MKNLLFVMVVLFIVTTGFAQLSGNYNYDPINRTKYGLTVPTANAQFVSDQVMIFQVKGLLNAEADAYSAIFLSSPAPNKKPWKVCFYWPEF